MGGFEPTTFRSESDNTNHCTTETAHIIIIIVIIIIIIIIIIMIMIIIMLYVILMMAQGRKFGQEYKNVLWLCSKETVRLRVYGISN